MYMATRSKAALKRPQNKTQATASCKQWLLRERLDCFLLQRPFYRNLTAFSNEKNDKKQH